MFEGEDAGKRDVPLALKRGRGTAQLLGCSFYGLPGRRRAPRGVYERSPCCSSTVTDVAEPCGAVYGGLLFLKNNAGLMSWTSEHSFREFELLYRSDQFLLVSVADAPRQLATEALQGCQFRPSSRYRSYHTGGPTPNGSRRVHLPYEDCRPPLRLPRRIRLAASIAATATTPVRPRPLSPWPPPPPPPSPHHTPRGSPNPEGDPANRVYPPSLLHRARSPALLPPVPSPSPIGAFHTPPPPCHTRARARARCHSCAVLNCRPATRAPPPPPLCGGARVAAYSQVPG